MHFPELWLLGAEGDGYRGRALDAEGCWIVVRGVSLLRVSGIMGFSTGGPVTLGGTQQKVVSEGASASKLLLEVPKFIQMLESRLKSWQTRHASGTQDTK